MDRKFKTTPLFDTMCSNAEEVRVILSCWQFITDYRGTDPGGRKVSSFTVPSLKAQILPDISDWTREEQSLRLCQSIRVLRLQDENCYEGKWENYSSERKKYLRWDLLNYCTLTLAATIFQLNATYQTLLSSILFSSHRHLECVLNSVIATCSPRSLELIRDKKKRTQYRACSPLGSQPPNIKEL